MPHHSSNSSGDNPATSTEDAERHADLLARLDEIERGVIDPYAFSAATLIQCTFPHSDAAKKNSSDISAGKFLQLVNGDMTLTMMASEGLPYGVYPRLIMAWLTREAIRRHKRMPTEEARRIPLGHTLTNFMRQMGIAHTGGKNGTAGRLREQLRRLFSTAISVKWTTTTGPASHISMENAVIADKAELWWDTSSPDQITLEESSVTLSDDFFRSLVQSPVPLNVETLRHIRRSPLAIDLYCWLTYRMSYLKTPTVVTWDQLRGQFGAGYPDTISGRKNWRRKVRSAMAMIQEAWPEMTATDNGNGILLTPGAPSVPKKEAKQIDRYINDGFDYPAF